MSAKTSPARRAAFLKALGETGNHTIAAAHAKVSRSWVTLHKTSDPAFRAACDAAVAGAAARARDDAAAGGSAKPSAKWGYIDGEEMVVRAGNGRRAVVARARLRQWTPRVEDAFLGTLAATCNVKLACRASGLSPASAYVRRMKWPAFGEKWKAALEAGYDRLEAALLDNAVGTLSGMPDLSPEAPMPPMTIGDAIQLLRLHRHAVRGVGNPLRQRKWRSLDDVRDSVVRKLEMVERAAAAEQRRAEAKCDPAPAELAVSNASG